MTPPAIEKFLTDLSALGFEPELVAISQNEHFAVLRNYTVESGKFKDRVIDLGLPALSDYPRRVGQSIHVKATPQLLQKQRIQGIIHIKESSLGNDWLYWSYQLIANSNETARELMNQINGIFKRV